MSKVKKSKTNVAGLSAVYSGVLQNLSMMQSADNAIESKASGVVAFSLTAIALLVSNIQEWHLIAVSSLFILIAALYLGVWCLRIRNYRSATVVFEDNPDYFSKDSEQLVKQLISDAEGANTDASAILDKKSLAFRRALILFVVGTLVGIFSLNF